MEQTDNNTPSATLPTQFDEIRPYEPGEMQQAFSEMLADRQFNVIMKGFAPWLPRSVRNALLRLAFTGVKTPLDFQLRFMKPVVKYIIRKYTDGVSFDDTSSTLNTQHAKLSQRYTFISNHRDIVLDSAFLDVLLIEAGYPTTVEIGIGDNLLIYPWIKRLVRMNKAFTVRRGLTPKEMLRSSLLMSQYIHYAVTTKRENIWIAQREGRAKDSDDRTQDAVLKMLAMGYERRVESGERRVESGERRVESGERRVESGERRVESGERRVESGAPADALNELNIVPLTISYELDPCDYLKAQEFQQKRDNPAFKKSRQDDLDNMRTGIFGYKGRVHYHCGQPVNTWMDELRGLPRKEFFDTVAKRIDREIHRGYRLYPCNYIALDTLEGNASHADHYTADDRQRFEDYLDRQLAKIQIANKDEAFLRERMLTMYANPVRNQLAAL